MLVVEASCTGNWATGPFATMAWVSGPKILLVCLSDPPHMHALANPTLRLAQNERQRNCWLLRQYYASALRIPFQTREGPRI